MAERPGNYVGATPAWPYLGQREGMWTLDEVERRVRNNDWYGGVQLIPSFTTAGEGSVLTVTVRGEYIPSGVYYWTIRGVAGTITAGDFGPNGALSGSVNVANNTGSFTLAIAADGVVETTETFVVELRTDNIGGQVIATTPNINITDGAAPTYIITPDVTTVNEGSTVTFNITTTNVANGTVIYWRTILDGTDSADFTDGNTYGSVTISNNAATVSRGLAADALTEQGLERFALRLHSSLDPTPDKSTNDGPILATSPFVTVVDTSQTLNANYSITPSLTTVNEGQTVVFTVNTTNVQSGTVLYWDLESTSGTFNADDVVEGSVSGTVTVNSNTASFSRTIKNDSLTEGLESFRARLRTLSSTGTIVTVSPFINVTDTSLTPVPTYTITPSSSSGNLRPITTSDFGGDGAALIGYTTTYAGDGLTFNISTANVPAGTTLYWKVDGAFNRTSGINNPTGTVVVSTLGTAAPPLMGFSGYFNSKGYGDTRFYLYTDAARTNLVGSSTVWFTRVDYTINPTSYSGSQGDTVPVTITVTSGNIPVGTPLSISLPNTTVSPTLDSNFSITFNYTIPNTGLLHPPVTYTEVWAPFEDRPYTRTLFELPLQIAGSYGIGVSKTLASRGELPAYLYKTGYYGLSLQGWEPYYAKIPASFAETESLVFMILSDVVAEGQPLYVTVKNITTSNSDLELAGGYGTTIFSAQCVFALVRYKATFDGLTDPNEQFYLEVRTGSTTGPILYTSETITITGP